MIIGVNITKATKEKHFFLLPLNNILNIVSKTNLSERGDPTSLIKTIITKTIDIELTLEICADILSLFTRCSIFFNSTLISITKEKEIQQELSNKKSKRKTFKYSILNRERRHFCMSSFTITLRIKVTKCCGFSLSSLGFPFDIK